MSLFPIQFINLTVHTFSCSFIYLFIHCTCSYISPVHSFHLCSYICTFVHTLYMFIHFPVHSFHLFIHYTCVHTFHLFIHFPVEIFSTCSTHITQIFDTCSYIYTCTIRNTSIPTLRAGWFGKCLESG